MEIKLTAEAASRMFGIWRAELEANPRARAVENGEVKLDTVPSAVGAVHLMDGSLVEVWYKASKPPTERAIREASEATQMMHMPRQRYTGKLIDIKRGADGTVYFLVRALERREEGTGMPAFRAFNPSKGQVLEMTINMTVSGAAPEPEIHTTNQLGTGATRRPSRRSRR
jgi:hypothetical protein